MESQLEKCTRLRIKETYDKTLIQLLTPGIHIQLSQFHSPNYELTKHHSQQYYANVFLRYKNMYTNIQKLDTINTINNILRSNLENNKDIQNDTIHVLSIQAVTEQIYFQFDQKYDKQTDGLGIDSPTSAIPAETYLQHMEHKQIYTILISNK
jgi:hypothetical protein